MGGKSHGSVNRIWIDTSSYVVHMRHWCYGSTTEELSMAAHEMDRHQVPRKQVINSGQLVQIVIRQTTPSSDGQKFI